MSYVNNKGADQPAHPHSLISVFVVRCLDSIISLDSIAEISRLKLASVAAQAGLCLGWSETPKDIFSHSLAHVHTDQNIQNAYHVNLQQVTEATALFNSQSSSESLVLYKLRY